MSQNDEIENERFRIVEGLLREIVANTTPAPSEAEDEFISDGFTSACAAIASSPKSAPSEAAKVYYAAPMMGFPCANCGKETLRMDGHVSHRASGDETEYYCDKPAQPEPAAPEMPEAVRLALERLRWDAQMHFNEGKFIVAASVRGRADALESWWRNLAQPVAVVVTPALERVLSFAALRARILRDSHQGDSIALSEQINSAIAAVRQQAAQPVRLEKVRAILNRLWAASGPEISDDQITAALAELDAAEGNGEGRG